jgi:RNA polymerase sigma-70 factor, ECF subfamily
MQPPTGLALDDATLAELYQRYAHTLLVFIRRYVSTREDAEDVLLDVFLAASEQHALANMSEGEQLAWLRRVAHYKCVDAYRRARRRPALSLEEIADQAYDDEERGPEQLALRAEEHALLRDHLARLPEAQQEILRLRFANGLRCVEIAQMYNKREGTVRMLLSRALNLLRGLYKQQAEEGERA